jgi:hypothetical protein
MGPSGREAIYLADSPQDDIVGRPKVRISNDYASNGTVRTLHQVVLPVYDAATGKYVKPITVNTTVIRDQTHSLTQVKLAQEIANEMLAQSVISESIAEATL